MPEPNDWVTVGQPTDDPGDWQTVKPSVSELAKQRLAGSMGAEKIGQTGGPGLASLVHGVGEFGAQVNPVSMVKGTAQLAAHPIDTLSADQGERNRILGEAIEAFKRGDYGTAVAKGIYSGIPLLGANMARSGDQFASGDTAGGVGSSIGQGLALAGPAALKNVNIGSVVPEGAADFARGLQTSVMKPSTTLEPAERAAIIETTLKRGVTPDVAGVDRVAKAIESISNTADETIKNAPNAADRVVSPGRGVQYSRDVEAKFSNQVNPASDVNQIVDSRNEFLDKFRSKPGGAVRNMTLPEAQALKKGTYEQLGDKAYGEVGTASEANQKALARALKDSVAEAFPEVADANGQLSDLYDVKPVVTKAANRIANLQAGISPRAAAAGGAVGALLGGPGGAGVGAIASFYLEHMYRDPVLRSKLAISLYRASKGSITIPMAKARVAAYVGSLGEAGNVTKGDFSSKGPAELPKAAENDQPDNGNNLARSVVGNGLARAANGQFLSYTDRLSDYAKP